MKWRNLKSFLRSRGIHALAGNEKMLRTETDGIAARYDGGTTPGGLHYYRCTDIVAELEECVREHAKAGRLTRRIGVTDDALRVTVLVDKGGRYTKGFVTVWDVDAGQSPTNSVFMGLYEGGDDRDSVLAVFGPAIRALEAASAAGINWPYQYGAALPATNDASVRAFYAHPLVKADRSRSTCMRDRAEDRGAVLTRLLARAPGPAHAKLPELPKVPYLSDECERCAALQSGGVRAPIIRTTPYRSIRIAWGGDIMFLHELVGTNGPNAIYPCHVCLIDRETLQTVGVPPAHPPALRSLATAVAHLLQLKSGPKKDQNRRSFSQVVAPIPTTEYRGHIALSPLHVTLGLVKDLVTKLFEFATELDKRALARRQWFCEPSLRLPGVRSLKDQIIAEQSLQRDIELLKNRLVGARRKLKTLVGHGMQPEMTDTNRRIVAFESEIKTNSERLLTVTNDIASAGGPFTRAVNDRIREFGVTDRPYHGGAYVGKDCERIMKHGTTISSVVRRVQLIDSDGNVTESGDDEVALQYDGLFAKLLECWRLYSAARPLCAHEVQLLEMRSAELATMWPRRFTPKFHLLTYHMPQFAHDWLSVGLSTEQCVESSHTIINTLDRTFAGITDRVPKLTSIGKRFLVHSDPAIPNFVPPPRICPHCTLPNATAAQPHCTCPHKRVQASRAKQ